MFEESYRALLHLEKVRREKKESNIILKMYSKLFMYLSKEGVLGKY